MSYLRVIPRDLFNEGNLLKCYGQLYLNLERMGLQDCLRHDQAEYGEQFEVHQFDDSGDLTLINVALIIHGRAMMLRRPLNARGAYPLWLRVDDDTEIEVFTKAGHFTREMKKLLAPITIDGIAHSSRGAGK